MPVLLATTAEGLATLTIDRPQRRNALDEPHWAELRDHARSLETARAVIVTGSAGHFCAGMDLSPQNPLLQKLLPSVLRQDERPLHELLLWLKDCVQAIADLPVLTIAAIEGACAGGGLEIALACDLRVAAADAHLSLPEARLGMIPDVGGTARLTRLVGPAFAADLICTGRQVPAEEAQRMGLVQHLTPPGGALARAQELAKLALKSAPTASRLALNVARLAPDLGLEEALSLETRAGVLALISGEAVEGIEAFNQKRPPRWSGR